MTSAFTAPSERRSYTTPWGVRHYTKADYRALEWSVSTTVTSRSNPNWWRFNDDQSC